MRRKERLEPMRISVCAMDYPYDPDAPTPEQCTLYSCRIGTILCPRTIPWRYTTEGEANE